jgi:hypothetical protein
MATYNEVKEDQKAAGFAYEYNKCVLIALAVVTDCGYTVARDAIRLRLKRTDSPTGGYYNHEYLPAYKWVLSAMGKDIQLIELENVRKVAKTVKGLNTRACMKLGLKDGFVQVRGHILAVKDYTVQDWSESRCLRIQQVHKVVEKA